MRPIFPAPAAFVLLAGLTATVFVLMQPAPVAPPAVRVGLGDGATDPVLNPRSGSYGSVVAESRGTAEVMER